MKRKHDMINPTNLLSYNSDSVSFRGKNEKIAKQLIEQSNKMIDETHLMGIYRTYPEKAREIIIKEAGNNLIKAKASFFPGFKALWKAIFKK